MDSKRQLYLFFIMLFLFTALVTARGDQTNQEWWNTDWNYRQPINLTEETGRDISNFPITIEIDTRNLIKNKKIKNDCSDIRFGDKTNLLNFSRRTACNSSSTNYTVEIPSISSNSQKIIYMYYNNSASDKNSNSAYSFSDYFKTDSTSEYDWSNRNYIYDSRNQEIDINLNRGESLVASRDISMKKKGYGKISMTRNDNNGGNFNSLILREDEDTFYQFNWTTSNLNTQGFRKVVDGEETDKWTERGVIDSERNIYNIETYWSSDSLKLVINGNERNEINLTDTTEINPNSFEYKNRNLDTSWESIEICSTKEVCGKDESNAPSYNKGEEEFQWDLWLDDKKKNKTISEGQSIDINVNSSYDTSKSIKLYLDGQKKAESSNTNELSYSTAKFSKDGYYDVSAVFGNIGSKIKRYLIVSPDETPPDIYLRSKELLSESDQVKFLYRAEDNFLKNLNCEIYVNGKKKDSESIPANSNSSFTVSTQESRDMDFNISCKDKAGNKGNLTGKFDADFTSPNISVSFPHNNSEVYTTEPDIEWNTTDELSSNINYSVYLNNSLKERRSTKNNTKVDSNIGSLTEGYYETKIVVKDEYSNTKSKKIYFRVKESYVELLEPKDNFNSSSKSIQFRYKFNNDRYDKATCKIKVNQTKMNETNIETNNNQLFSPTDLEPGLGQKWKVKCSTPVKDRSSSRVINIDPKYPKYGNLSISEESPTIYNVEEQKFSVDADDNLKLSSVKFQHNFSGRLTNKSLNCDECGDSYEVGFNLSAGTYSYRFYFEDYVGNLKSTEKKEYKINKADPGLNIQADSLKIIRDSPSELSCKDTTDQTNKALYRNGTLVGKSRTNKIQDNNSLSVGKYKYWCQTGGNENYTSNNISTELEVVKEMNDSVNITINGDSENKTIKYTREPKITVFSNSGNDTLYLDGEKVSQPYEKRLGVGEYNFFGKSTGSYRYTYSKDAQSLKIEKAEPDISLSSSKGFEILKNQSTTIKCSAPNNQVTISLYKDGKFLGDSEGGTVKDSGDFDTGNYNYKCNSSSTTNYTQGELKNTLKVSDKLEPELELNSDPGFSANPSTEVNVSCKASHNQEKPVLYYNGNEVSNPHLKEHSLGIDNYSCKISSTEDYKSGEISKDLTIKKNPGLELLINNSSSKFSTGQNEEINLTGSLSSTSGTVSIYEEGKKLWQGENTTEIVKEYSETGLYQVSALYSGNQEYFSKNKTYYINISDLAAPEIKKSIPKKKWRDKKNTKFKFKVDDYNRFSCGLYIDDSLKQVKNNIKSGNYSFSKSIDEGKHNWSFKCEDTRGNIGESDGEINIDTGNPVAEILTEDMKTGDPNPNIKVRINDSINSELEYNLKVNDSVKKTGSVESSSIESIRMPQLGRGPNKIKLIGIDSAGNQDTSEDLTINLSGSSVYLLEPGYDDAINSDSIDFKFKYFSDHEPLGCSLYIDGNKEDSVSSLKENSEEILTGTGLPDSGEVTWNITCRDQSSDVFASNKNKLTIDSEDPEINSKSVNRDSGHRYKGESTKFKLKSQDNTGVENAYINATWASIHKMECSKETKETECFYEDVVPAGNHEYNYIIEDKAGNKIETDTKNYNVKASDANFVLKLNGKEDDIEIEKGEQVKISGSFIDPEEGSIYFKVNGEQIGKCGEGSGCSFFYTFDDKGEYRVKAEFYSTRSFININKELKINVNSKEAKKDLERVSTDQSSTDDSEEQEEKNNNTLKKGKNKSLKPKNKLKINSQTKNKKNKNKGSGKGLGIQNNQNKTNKLLDLDTSELSANLNPGDSKTKYIEVENNFGKAKKIEIELNMEKASTNKNEITLEPSESYNLPVYFNIPKRSKVGVYRGNLEINDRNIPVKVKLGEDTGLLDVKLKMDNNIIKEGEKLTYSTDIFNMGDNEKLDIGIETKVRTKDGKLVKKNKETLNIESSASHSFEVTKDLEPGVYEVEAITKYGNKTASTSTQLKVERDREDEWKRLLIILTIFIALTAYSVGLRLRKKIKLCNEIKEGVKETRDLIKKRDI